MNQPAYSLQSVRFFFARTLTGNKARDILLEEEKNSDGLFRDVGDIHACNHARGCGITLFRHDVCFEQGDGAIRWQLDV